MVITSAQWQVVMHCISVIISPACTSALVFIALAKAALHSPISITFVFASSNSWNIICITYSFLYFSFNWNTEIYTEPKSTLESLNERRIIDICKILQKLSKLESAFLRILIYTDGANNKSKCFPN